MRRILLVLTVGLMMAAMLLVMAVPAFAVPRGSGGCDPEFGCGGGSMKPPNFIPATASDSVATQPVGGFGRGGELSSGEVGGGGKGPNGAGGGGGGGSAGNPCLN